MRFDGNKINCFPRDQSLSDLLYSTTKTNLEEAMCKQIENFSIHDFEKRTGRRVPSSHHLQSHSDHVQQQSSATFAGNSALLPSNLIDFAMLPAQRLF